MRFKPLAANNCVYFNSFTRFIIVTYVNDFLIVGPSGSTIERFKHDIIKELDIEDLGPT